MLQLIQNRGFGNATCIHTDIGFLGMLLPCTACHSYYPYKASDTRRLSSCKQQSKHNSSKIGLHPAQQLRTHSYSLAQQQWLARLWAKLSWSIHIRAHICLNSVATGIWTLRQGSLWSTSSPLCGTARWNCSAWLPDLRGVDSWTFLSNLDEHIYCKWCWDQRFVPTEEILNENVNCMT